ncbi:MAG: hypothetical protein K9M99_02955 [Candidatus Cloacimonetes bacterium]|nr:hypothetical protein [Candidatus Cloacimonadota bacterium]
MFCPGCGNEVANDAVICVKCGRRVGKEAIAGAEDGKWTTGVFVALILVTVLVPYVGGLIGLIFGIIGLTKPAKKKQGLILILTAVGGFILSMAFWGAVIGSMFLADSYDYYGVLDIIYLIA